MSNSNERFLALREAARNDAEKPYFEANRHFITKLSVGKIFCDGFDRGYNARDFQQQEEQDSTPLTPYTRRVLERTLRFMTYCIGSEAGEICSQLDHVLGKSNEEINEHEDDVAVDRFAAAMKAKLAKKRAEGRGGWKGCSPEGLSTMLINIIAKGDPIDIANFAMMLQQTGNKFTTSELDYVKALCLKIDDGLCVSLKEQLVKAKEDYENAMHRVSQLEAYEDWRPGYAPTNETVLARSTEGNIYMAKTFYGLSGTFWISDGGLNYDAAFSLKGIIIKDWMPIPEGWKIK